MNGFKYIETLQVTFEKMCNNDIISKTAYFNSDADAIINENEISESLKYSQERILNIISIWISEGSGWTVKSVDNHYLNIVKYNPVKGSSYIKLPEELRNSKKGLINIKNEDDECFRWCHIRYLNPQDKGSQRIKKCDKNMIDKLDYSGIEFPVTQKQYNKIEKQNKININVFGYEEKQPFPIYISREKYENPFNLLLITEDEKNHYVLIKDFNRFMYNQTKHKEKKHFCMYCLQCFTTEIILKNHSELCMVLNGKQGIQMPNNDNNKLKFENTRKEIPVPFVIYADFEAITERVQNCQPDNNKSFTEEYQKHTDCSYAYKLVCCYNDKHSKPFKMYRGENAVNKFMNEMLKEVKYCQKILKKNFSIKKNYKK